MPEDIIISFDDLEPGTVVVDHYHARGVDFRASSFFDGGLPFVEKLADGEAHSGNHVLVIKNCSGEFCPSAVVGKFTHTRQRVQVFVGNLRDPSSIARVNLHAYNASGEVLTSTSTTVSGGSGIHTLLEVSRPTADIDSFEVRADGFTSRLALDDLRFDAMETPQEPDFGITREGPVGDGVRQGFAATATIKVNRVNGSVGAIHFEASGLPSGVTATFTPNPTDVASVTLTIQAAANASTAAATPVTVTATPQVSSAGSTPRTLVFPLTVAANFAIAPLTIDVPPCTTTAATLKIYVPNTLGSPESGLIPGGNFSSPIQLSLFTFGGSALPPGVELVFEPSSVSLAGGLEVTTTVRVTAQAGSLTGNISLIVIGGAPDPTASAALTLRPVAGTLNSFSPKVGETPHALLPGTEIVLNGTGFCSDPAFPIEVQFDNVHARAKVTSVSADGRQAHVRVPRLATDGPLTVITPAGSFTSPENFTVRSHRNTHGFAFMNLPFSRGVNFDDLTEAFGKNQTYLTITIDPCKVLTLGFKSCPGEIFTVPSPLGLIVLAAATSVNAHCFGMSLTSERLLKGDTPLNAFLPSGAATVWQLSAPEGPLPTLGHHLRIQSITQMSSEVWHHWLSRVGEGMLTAPLAGLQVAPLRDAIRAELLASNYPLIMMRNGSKGHVVLAYDIEDSDEPNVAFYIYIYDPNVEFSRGKITTNEDDDADAHKEREERLSRITIRDGGSWVYPGLGGWGPFPFHDFKHNLVLTPYNVIPRNPTFPATIKGIATLVFGAGEIVQIADAEGRTLLNPDGSLNSDPITRLPEVAPWAPFVQQADSTLSDAYLLGNHGHHQWTLQGTDNGHYSNVIFGQNFGVRVDELPVNPTSMDEILVHPGEASFGFRTNDPAKPLTVTLVAGGADDTSVRTVALKTISHQGGLDRIAFDASRDLISYHHEGEPTSYSITLGRVGGIGMPETFSSIQLDIRPGEKAMFRPTDWSSLGQSPVELILIGQDGTQQSQILNNSVTQQRGFEITRLQVEDEPNQGKILQVITGFSEVDSDATALVVWLVIKDGEIVGQSHITLSMQELQTKEHSNNWIFTPHGPGQYEFVGMVTVISGDLQPSSYTQHKTHSFSVE